MAGTLRSATAINPIAARSLGRIASCLLRAPVLPAIDALVLRSAGDSVVLTGSERDW